MIMRKFKARTLFTGLLWLTVLLSLSIPSGTAAIAHIDGPVPTPPANFESGRTPEMTQTAGPLQINAQPITSTSELTPERAVRDIQTKGRAMLYAGHMLTPTQTSEAVLIGPDALGGNGPQSNPPLTTISGTVIVSETGLPISYVRVDFYTPKGYRGSEMTDRQGQFARSFYDWGSYLVRIDPSQVYPYDLAGEWYDDQPLSTTATLISTTVASLNGAANLRVSLNRGSQITGTVVALDTGLPLTGMTVAVYDANGTFLHSVISDAAGHYTTSGLRTGRYSVCAYAYLEADSMTRQRYPGGCYSHQDTPATATPLTVTAPSGLPNITVAVPTASQITGIVTAADTGAPLAGVEVDALNVDGTASRFTVTNTSGQYVLDALRPGGYTLYFSTRNGTADVAKYISEYYDGKSSRSSANVITVTASVTVSNVNATLGLNGSITGVVTAEDTGAPLSNVQIIPTRGNVILITNVSTNARGEYTLSDLDPGTYNLYFSTHFSTVSTTRQYFGRYFTDSMSLNSASPVSVTVNHTTGGINARLDRGGQITGVVIARDTRVGLSQVLVSVERYRTSDAHYQDYPSATALTDSQGQYTVTAAGGLNTVSFLPYDQYAPYCGQTYNQHATNPDADAVSVVARHVTANINGILEHTSRINGVVTAADDGAPLQRVLVRLRPLNRTDNNFNNFHSGIITQTDLQGRYTFGPLCAGSYTLRFDPTYGPPQTAQYAPAYYNQKPSLETSDVLNLTSGVTLTVSAALNRLAHISGTVTAADTGEPLANADVHAIDLNGRDASDLGYAGVSSNGSYSLSLPPGRYKLVANSRDTSYASEYFSGTAQLSDAATLELTSTQVLGNINFALQHGGVIQGQVTDQDTGEPIPFAFIEVYDTSNSNLVISSSQTDENGIYVLLTRVHAGTYKVRGSSGRYISQFSGGSADFGSALTISVTDGQTTQANVSLWSLQSPRLSTHMRLPMVMRQSSDLVQIAPTPIVVPSTVFADAAEPTQ